MTPTLEILLSVCQPDARLVQTAASLVAQSDRGFEVRLGDNSSGTGSEHLEEAARSLIAAGITVHRMKTSGPLTRIEHWNSIHSQASADWLKLLLPGEVLKPTYVEKLKRRLNEKPEAHLVRCDAELRTDWGVETLRAPFEAARVTAAEFADHFPARVDWICRSANVAYTRLAWLETGGHCCQLPGLANLNLNVTLALHHGLENIPEPLVAVASADKLPLNESPGERVNLPLELWLILRQARNYCIASKVPWHCALPSWRAAMAWVGRW